MIKKELLSQVIEELYDFANTQQDRSNYGMSDFIGYLNSKSSYISTKKREIGGKKEPAISESHQSEFSDITVLLVLMYRYAKGYIKKVLKNAQIQTADEFSFLITLVTFDSLTKTHLSSLYNLLVLCYY